MGGGDLNMKKSWHPVLLVNQERVWKAEKAANEEKKMLAQLRKEREEERQLAELQRLQEATTGKKRVEKMDWMYAAPGAEGGALGGQKLGEREMEEYLLGKKRVDEVLAQGDKNVGASHREFIAVQNANNPRDTAAKIREDPLLAIKKQEQAALTALMNRPDIRKKLKAAKNGKEEKEDKEERRARKKAEKEERRKARHESKHSRHSRSHRDSRTPVSDYSDDRDRDRKRIRDSHDSRDDRRRRDYERERDRSRSRSISPKRERDHDREYRRRDRDESPRRYRDHSSRRSDGYRRDDDRGRYRDGDRSRDDNRRDRDGHSYRDDHRIPPSRQYFNGNSDSRDIKPHPSRPSALDMADRPTSSSIHPRELQHNEHANGNGHSGNSNSNAKTNGNGTANHLDDMRAARLAAMSSSATELYNQRAKTLAQRAEEEKKELEKEAKLRAKYGKDQANAGFFSQQTSMGLSESLQRRAGKGLLKDI
ncbi:pre-mRNA-splicing factor CWC25 [Kwoniella heveanensis CBS 569]|nr:pre-mRNA-splicing factor CWC25 [Kwoniella heveanensis CBS 569]